MWWILVPILAAIVTLYMVIYVLVRTSGDGRGAWRRLMHPDKGGTQEEYGGDGTGKPLPKDPES